MEYSTLTGSLTVREEDVFRVKSGEKFYNASFTAKGVIVPCVISEYLTKDFSDKVDVFGYLKSETIKGKLYTYFDIIKVSDSKSNRENSTVKIVGIVSKVNEMKVQIRDAVQIKTFIVKYKCSDDSYTVIHCVAKGKLARRLSSLTTGELIKLKGKVKRDGKRVEILITEIVGGN